HGDGSPRSTARVAPWWPPPRSPLATLYQGRPESWNGFLLAVGFLKAAPYPVEPCTVRPFGDPKHLGRVGLRQTIKVQKQHGAVAIGKRGEKPVEHPLHVTLASPVTRQLGDVGR